MKLFYRGISYEYDPNQARSGNAGRPHRATQSQTPYTLIYRGTTYRVDPNAKPETDSRPAAYDLIYRGTTYHVQRTAEGATATVVPSAKQLRMKVPAFVSQILNRHNVNRVHQANLLQNLQRRLKVAQERGDQELVGLLRAELQQIAPKIKFDQFMSGKQLSL